MHGIHSSNQEARCKRASFMTLFSSHRSLSKGSGLNHSRNGETHRFTEVTA